MVTVEEALEYIRKNKVDFGSEFISYEVAEGRILDEDITADRDFPPFHRATMDGIVISHSDWSTGLRDFEISGEQFAGEQQESLKQGTCMEIMTGAVVPHNADVVIRYEDLELRGGRAYVSINEITKMMNIHLQGNDATKGDTLVEKGKRISHGDIGILASVGKTRFQVKKLPSVAIISTGDELVDVDQEPLPHQIRKSNVHTLCSFLKSQGISFKLFHILDELEKIKLELDRIMDRFDTILLSGGVSKGKRDFIPEALESLGVKKHFHRIQQRPGKPLWFGSNDRVTVFGFPGNPVSTVACYQVYFRTWLKISLDQEVELPMAELDSDLHFPKPLTFFVHAKVYNDAGVLKASPLRGNGSGDLVSLSTADGFLQLPADKEVFKMGEKYPIHLF